MSQKKSIPLAEIVSMMRQNGIQLSDIESYEETSPRSVKETPRFVLILAYLGGLLMLGGLGIFAVEHWQDLGSAERIIMTYGVGVSLYVLAFAFYYKKASSLILSNLFVLAFLFQWGGLGVALMEFMSPGIDNILFALGISSIMVLQTGMTFFKVRLTVILFMGLYFLGASYIFLVAYLVTKDLIPRTLFADVGSIEVLAVLGSLALIAITQKIRHTPYKSICGLGFFVAALSFYGAFYHIFDENNVMDFFGVVVLLGLILSQVTRSKSMLALTALALSSYLVFLTSKYYMGLPWWPIVLVVLGLVLTGTAVFFYRKAQSFR